MNKQHIISRFIKYVIIDTESDPVNPNFPSVHQLFPCAIAVQLCHWQSLVRTSHTTLPPSRESDTAALMITLQS